MKPRKASNAHLEQSIPHALRKPPREQASNPLLVQRQRSYQTNTCLQTRSCSCEIYRTMWTKRALLPSLAVLKGSRKSDWCLGARELPLSSTRMNLGLLVPRRLRRGCLWERNVFWLHTSDSEVGYCTVWASSVFTLVHGQASYELFDSFIPGLRKRRKG